MKNDFLTYVTKSLVKQRGLNLIAGAAIIYCVYCIGKLSVKVAALEAEGETV